MRGLGLLLAVVVAEIGDLQQPVDEHPEAHLRRHPAGRDMRAVQQAGQRGIEGILQSRFGVVQHTGQQAHGAVDNRQRGDLAAR